MKGTCIRKVHGENKINMIKEIRILYDVTVQIWFAFPPPQVQICKTFWLVLMPPVRSKQKFAVVSLIVPDVVTGVQVCCGKLEKHCQIFILTPLAPVNITMWARKWTWKKKCIHWDWTPASRHHWDPSTGLTEVKDSSFHFHIWVSDPLQSKLDWRSIRVK